MALTQTFRPDPVAPPYVVNPASPWRVKFDFRVEFTNGGYVEGKDFLLDIEGDSISASRPAEMTASAMNLLRAGSATIERIAVVPRGAHADSA